MVYFRRPFGDPFISFGFGFAIGGWLNHDFDWHNHNLIEWGQRLSQISCPGEVLIHHLEDAGISGTLAAEVVLADRYVSGGGDPNLIDQQPWDPSIKALAPKAGLGQLVDQGKARSVPSNWSSSVLDRSCTTGVGGETDICPHA